MPVGHEIRSKPYNLKLAKRANVFKFRILLQFKILFAIFRKLFYDLLDQK